MDRDDGLTRASRTGDPCRGGISALDQRPLGWVEEVGPLFPRQLERQCHPDILHYAEAALCIGMSERIGDVDRLQLLQNACCGIFEKGFTCFGW